MKHKFILATLPVVLAMVGCTSLAPQYERQETVIPEKFNDTGIYSNNKTVAELPLEELKWENYVHNDHLKKVISQALENNKDLKIAFANIQAAKAQYGISNSDRFPSVNGSVSGSRGQTSPAGISESVQANLGIAAFEIDAFGRMSNLSEAALQSYLATEEAKRVTEISVIAETAKAYFNIAVASSQLEIAQKTEQAAKKSTDLMRKRVELGASSAKDLSDAESIYFMAKADVSNYKTQVEQSINAIHALAGTYLDVNLLPKSVEQVQDAVASLNTVTNSDILFKRPDVLAAEHQLLAANANIGAARAAFFPRISLTTSVGVASSELSGLFNNNFKAWSFAPSITIPIFDYGRNKANLEYSEAQRDKLLATYEKTVQTAFRETSDALARKATIREQTKDYNSYVASTQKSFDLATKMYEVGVKDYLSVLTAQTNLYNAQKNALNLERESFENKINLYKVLAY